MTKNHTVNKDLKQIERFKAAASEVSHGFIPTGLAFIFLLGIFFVANVLTGAVNNSTVIIVSAVLGGYMALNIGANDVANNVGPAVGSKALTMAGALIVAVVFESAGALIAGGDVVSTVSKGIINPEHIAGNHIFVFIMMSALLAAALWLNIATFLGAPVSTTHSIVGGVMGSGIAAAGVNIVNWPIMSAIAASWVISPVMGGFIAAFIFKFVKHRILLKDDKIEAAKRWVPILVSIMCSAFTMYLMLKGFKKIWKVEEETVWITGVLVLLILPILIKPFIVSSTGKLENSAKSVNKLFTVPLIIAASLLSFAHGANDVANAVGPLAAIVGIAGEGSISGNVGIPIWVMMIGAFGISLGLVLFGPKIIRTVGEKITKLDQVRAYCVALSAAITVIIASHFGLPVSSTHIAVGSIFGVGLYREFSSHSKRKKGMELSKKKMEKRKLVRRAHLFSIAAAWVVTVPCTALISGGVYFAIVHFNIGDFLM